jgi:ribulose 1,5-bisphosphate synthetase/thiazole synthase
MTPITRREFVKGSATLPLALSTLTTGARTAMPSESFDVVVAGAGHNSLLCAAYLAKAGYKVVVLEGQPMS